MTGFNSKREAAADKLQEPDALTIAYQSGFYDGKKATLAQPAREPLAFDAFLESEDFYELMQAYRHFPIDALVQFEAIKDALRTAHNIKERNFCPRCGKRTNDIHTCTLPQGAA